MKRTIRSISDLEKPVFENTQDQIDFETAYHCAVTVLVWPDINYVSPSPSWRQP